MYITRDEAIVTLHDLMNSGILDADLCDELNDIASCIAHKDIGLNTWGADDDVIDLFVAKRSDLITPAWRKHIEELYEKYKIKAPD